LFFFEMGQLVPLQHGVVDAAGRALGSGLYPEAAMFNHSCAPNAVVSFGPGGKLRVRAIAPISEGDEVGLYTLTPV
jgi:hypothetical protein